MSEITLGSQAPAGAPPARLEGPVGLRSARDCSTQTATCANWPLIRESPSWHSLPGVPGGALNADVQVALYLNPALRAMLERLRQDAELPTLSELIRRLFVVVRTDKRAVAELQKLQLVV